MTFIHWRDGSIRARRPRAGKGDFVGHPFRGNQHGAGRVLRSAVARWVAEGAPSVQGPELAALQSAVHAAPPAPEMLSRGLGVSVETYDKFAALGPGDQYKVGEFRGNQLEGFTTEGDASGWSASQGERVVVLELQEGYGHALDVHDFIPRNETSEHEFIVGGEVPVAGSITGDGGALHVLLGDQNHPSLHELKGDFVGHPFRGNQWTGAGGGGGLPPITDPEKRGPAVEKLVAAAKAAGLDTETLHDKVDDQLGRYKAEREAIHDEIVSEMLQQAIDGGARSDREAIIMGGIYGAGKTTALKTLVETKEFVVISPDDMKEQLAKRGLFDPPKGVFSMEASTLIHEESAEMAWDLAQRATSSGRNIVWDISMGSSGAVQRRIDEIDNMGPYQTTGVFVDSPIPQAVRGVAARYAEGLARNPATARYIEPALVRETADPTSVFSSRNRAAFEELKTQFDDWVLIDNTDYAGRIVDTSRPDLVVDGKIKL